MIKVKKILISQPEPENGKSPYFDLAEKHNLSLTFHPFIRVEGISSKEFRQQKLDILSFGGVVFTAKLAVDHFFRLCEELKVTVPDTMFYFCVSESVALYLQKYIVYRKRKIFFSETGKLEGLKTALDKHKKETLLVPVTENHKEDLMLVLDERKINYTKAVMYRTVANDITEEQILSFDMLVFFSPIGIESLFKNAPEFEQGNMKIACFGTSTAKAVKESGLELSCEAPQPEFPSMVAVLDDFLKKNHKAHK